MTDRQRPGYYAATLATRACLVWCSAGRQAAVQGGPTCVIRQCVPAKPAVVAVGCHLHLGNSPVNTIPRIRGVLLHASAAKCSCKWSLCVTHTCWLVVTVLRQRAHPVAVFALHTAAEKAGLSSPAVGWTVPWSSHVLLLLVLLVPALSLVGQGGIAAWLGSSSKRGAT